MESMYEKLEVFKLAIKLADEIWEAVILWDNFFKNTIGNQLVRAADSIGANITEDLGRGSYLENRRFFKISRGSLFEVKHFLHQAYKRPLLNEGSAKRIQQIQEELTPKLSAYINYLSMKIKSEK